MTTRADWDRIVYDERTPGQEMDRHMGHCHLCVVGEHKAGGVVPPVRPITYCKVCRHWFCHEHRSAVFSRGIEAIRELIGGRADNCCGPLEEAK